MADKVLVTVLIKNQIQLIGLTSNVREHLNCAHLKVTGEYWLVPVVKGGILQHYKQDIAATKPTIDSIRAVRVRDTESRTDYFVGVADAGTAADVIAKCQECCETATALADITIPKVYAEETLCGNDTDGYTLVQQIPALGAGQNYKVYGSKNGVAFTPDLYANNYASLADVVTAMTTNWAANGTFAAVGQKLTYTTATGGTAALHIVIV